MKNNILPNSAIWLKILQTTARQAGNLTKSYFQQNFESQHKKDIRDIVTQVDIEAQELIRKNILEQADKEGLETSKIGFLGEEELENLREYNIIIDPIDGTINFSAGLSYYGVSIALEYQGQIQVSVVYYPVLDAVVWAMKGQGVGSDKDLRFEKAKSDVKLQDTVLIHHLSKDPATFEQNLDNFAKLRNNCRSFRVMGAACIDMLEIIFPGDLVVLNLGVKIWDIAASSLIIQELGYSVLDLQGQDWQPDLLNPTQKTPFVAGAYPACLELLKKLGKIDHS